MRLLSSSRSAGSEVECLGSMVTVEELKPDSFEGIDVALFSAGGSISKEYAPHAVRAGATVIDNSSAFRMDAQYPLVVPEINADAIRRNTIIANPNCSTIIMLMGVTPIRQLFGVRRMSVSTYQAASGAGAAAMKELEDQARDVLAGREPEPHVFDDVCAFNVFSHDSAIGDDGYNVEERKMVDETRKIWNDPDVAITATCIRVPVLRTHCEAINLTLDRPVTDADVSKIREAIEEFPGAAVTDDRESNRFPTPRRASGIDDVLVGRIRLDRSQMVDDSRSQGLEIFVAGDQLRKGAALNAIQIMDELVSHHWS